MKVKIGIFLKEIIFMFNNDIFIVNYTLKVIFLIQKLITDKVYLI